jgi:hypothetical protein
VDTLAHDPPKCERFGDQIMRNYDALQRDLGTNETFSRQNRRSNFADRALDVRRYRTIFLVPIIAKPLDRTERSQRADQKG